MINLFQALKRTWQQDSAVFGVSGAYIFTCFGFFLTAFVPPDNFKHDYQWIVVGLAYLIAAIFFLRSRQHLSRLRDFLASVKWFWGVWLITTLWLFLMLFVHGDRGGNLMGVNSGFLGLCVLPIAAYLGHELSWSRESWLRKQLSWVLLMSLLPLSLFENIYLAMHRFAGIPASLSYHTTEHLVCCPYVYWSFLPRMFVNVREGNILSLMGLCVVYFLLAQWSPEENMPQIRGIESDPSSLVWCLKALLFSCFLNAFLTQGRAILLALTIPMLILYLASLLSTWVVGHRYIRHIARMFFVTGVASYVVSSGLNILAPRANRLLTSSMDDMNTLNDGFSAGRALIWKEWLEQGFFTSPWFGSGFNFRPFHDSVHYALSSAHNIFITVLADGGLLGFLVCILWFCVVWKNWMADRFTALMIGCFVTSFVIFSITSSVFVRPIGCIFLPLLVFLLFAFKGFSLQSLDGIVSPEVHALPLGKRIWSVGLGAFLFVFGASFFLAKI